jgi:hypothetical protein
MGFLPDPGEGSLGAATSLEALIHLICLLASQAVYPGFCHRFVTCSSSYRMSIITLEGRNEVSAVCWNEVNVDHLCVHEISEHTWWILNPGLRRSLRYSELYGYCQRGLITSPSWLEKFSCWKILQDDAAPSYLWFEVVLRKWLTRCWEAFSALQAPWRPEAQL